MKHIRLLLFVLLLLPMLGLGQIRPVDVGTGSGAGSFGPILGTNGITVISNGILYIIDGSGISSPTNGVNATQVSNIVNASIGSSTNALGQGATNSLWANTVWVDSANGRDATALRGDANKPFAGLSNAFLALQSGDTLIIRPGTHAVTPFAVDITNAPLQLIQKTNVAIVGLNNPRLVANATGIMLAMRQCSNILIYGVEFVGKKTAGNLADVTTVIGAVDALNNLTLDHVTIRDAADNAVLHNNWGDGRSDNWTYRDCNFINIGTTNVAGGLQNDGAATYVFRYTRISRNYFENCLRDIETFTATGGPYEATDGAVIENNVSVAPIEYWLLANHTNHINWTIRGNTVAFYATNRTVGASYLSIVTHAINWIVEGNKFTGPKEVSGFEFLTSSTSYGPYDNIAISGNLFDGLAVHVRGGSAIGGNFARNLSLIGNHFRHSGYDSVASGFSHSQIALNQFVDFSTNNTSGSAIRIGSAGAYTNNTNVIIFGNTFNTTFNNSTNTIILDSDTYDARVYGNRKMPTLANLSDSGNRTMGNGNTNQFADNTFDVMTLMAGAWQTNFNGQGAGTNDGAFYAKQVTSTLLGLFDNDFSGGHVLVAAGNGRIIESGISSALASNLFAMNISNVVAATGIKIITNNGTLIVSNTIKAITNQLDVQIDQPLLVGHVLVQQNDGKWHNFSPYAPGVAYSSPGVITNFSIYVGTNIAQTIAIISATNFGINFVGSPLSGETVSIAVFNTNPVFNINMTNASYNPIVASNVFVYVIPSNSIASFTFVSRTNWNAAATNRWELDRVISKQMEIVAGDNIVFTTNSTASAITISSAGGGAQTNAFQFGAASMLTLKAGARQTNANFYGVGTNHLDFWVEGEAHSAGGFFDQNFSGDFALVSDPTKEIVESSVTSSELGYLSGVTSGIQAQLSNDVRVAAGSNAVVTAAGSAGRMTYTVSGKMAMTNLLDFSVQNVSGLIGINPGQIAEVGADGLWHNFFPFYQIFENITVVSNVNIYVGTNIETSYAFKTASNITITYVGTPLPGERWNAAIYNTNAVLDIYMTNSSFDPRVGSNVIAYLVPSNSIATFTFINRTNWNTGATNRWELDRYIQEETELQIAGQFLRFHTNSPRSTITISNTWSGAGQTISGAGNGNTNYLITLSTNSINDFYLGSSNVNIYQVTGGAAGWPINWTAVITNLSAISWGVLFGAEGTTNHFRFSGPAGTTNFPTVLTNGMALVLKARTDGTNHLIDYKYYAGQ